MKYVYYILRFIQSQRRSGTTTLIQKIATENDCHVVVRYSDDIKKQYPKELWDKCITLEQLFNLEGIPPKPILFETPAIKHLCEMAKERYEIVSDQNFRMDSTLNKIKKAIYDFELSGDKIGSVFEKPTI